jgi:malonyl CoA-acyl carrier protein transacylase
MKLGFIYAGQGSQKVGMGQDLYEKYPEFKETFDNVQGVDFDLKKVGGKKLIQRVNGQHANYFGPIFEGAVIDLYWEQ